MTTTEAVFEGPSWSGRIIKLLVVTAFLAAGAAAGYWVLVRPGEKTPTAAAATTEASGHAQARQHSSRAPAPRNPPQSAASSPSPPAAP
jgi:hypothetical protein